MSLVPQLLQAIVAAKGDAVVLHTGDIPYIAGAGTETEISADRLTSQAVGDVLKQLLPEPSQRTFDLLGSVCYECPPLEPYPGERFVVVALHEADELWLEIRREAGSPRSPSASAVPIDVLAATSGGDDLVVPDFESLWPDEPRGQQPPSGSFDARAGDHATPSSAGNRAGSAGRMWSNLDEFDLAQLDEGPATSPPVENRPAATGQTLSDLSEFELDKLDDPRPPPRLTSPVPHEASRVEALTVGTGAGPADRPASAGLPSPGIEVSPPRQAVVLSMARTPIRNDPREPLVDPAVGELVRLLRIVAARGGSALYITSNAQPSMRVDGEMRALDGEAPLGAADTDTLLRGMLPKATRDELAGEERTEWISDPTDLGRVRCVSFRDHRGAGGIFRILTAHPASVEQLGLSREVQALALAPDGLVLVAGPRSSGKSTLIAAFVDLINRTRRDHVIMIESETVVVHESRGSTISQREVRGDPQRVLAAVRSALREDPDVLVIDAYPDDALTYLTLESAGAGRLVIASLPAHTTADGVDRFIDHFPPERRPRARLAFAESLRGIIAQALLRKPGGGRLAAREVLLNTPAVTGLIAGGKTAHLPMALEEGRQIGMMSLNDGLAALVKSSAVDVREAYRRAGDRKGLLALLKRQGVDTTLLERHA